MDRLNEVEQCYGPRQLLMAIPTQRMDYVPTVKGIKGIVPDAVKPQLSPNSVALLSGLRIQLQDCASICVLSRRKEFAVAILLIALVSHPQELLCFQLRHLQRARRRIEEAYSQLRDAKLLPSDDG